MSNTGPEPAKVICTRTKLKKGVLQDVRHWLKTLNDCKDEVIETFRDEGVWVESAFLEKVGEDDYLVYYMRADDVQQAKAVCQKSSHPIDHFHRECWRKFADTTSVLELAFDLQREPSLKPEDVLVDVIALSEKRCSSPIRGALAYATRENFLGRVVDGYSPSASHVCLLSRKAAEHLCSVQNALNAQGLGLFIYDAYRPLRAVRDFSAWVHETPGSAQEQERKALHYPHLEKTELAPSGYIPDAVSRHCFGHSVDVSLIDSKTNQLLDMGTIFDYFDSSSHHPDTPPERIGDAAFRNRQLLAQAMLQGGFIAYPLEYWHFDFRERELTEPADLEITLSLAGMNVQ